MKDTPRGAGGCHRSAVAGLAAVWPTEPAVTAEVGASYRSLGIPSAEPYLRAGNTLGLAVGVVTGIATLLVYPSALLLVLVGVAIPPLVARRGVVLLATLARTDAVGAGPALYVRLVLRLQTEASLERAVRFAAETGDDRLSASLADHARRATATPDAGLQTFAAVWGARAPGLERASALVVAAASAPPAARRRGCERALSTVLDATRDRMATFATDVRGPVTGIYAFGVLLPLALVGVLPAASVAGLSVSASLLVGLYDVALPTALAGASLWLVARRPVAFPAPRVTHHHAAVPDRRARALLVGAFVGGSATVVAGAPLPWATLLAGVGVGVGTTLVVWLGPACTVRDRVRAVERGLPDALTLVGRRVAEGTAVERALAETADELPAETGALLCEAASRGEALRTDLSRAFFGSHGVLADVPSPRARDVATLLTLAATEGQPSGEVLVAAGDYIRELQRVERAASRELGAITGTLSNTAVLFGPLVGGVTVAMTGQLASSPATDGGVGSVSALSTPVLGQAVGLYVLLLAAQLTALATVLEDGFDPTLVAYRVGIALPVASVTYVVAVVVTGRLL